MFCLQKQQLKCVLEKESYGNCKEPPSYPRTSYKHFVYIQFKSCVYWNNKFVKIYARSSRKSIYISRTPILYKFFNILIFAEWLTDSQDYCQRFSLSHIFDTSQAGFQSVQNLSSGFVERICAVLITTTQWCHKDL